MVGLEHFLTLSAVLFAIGLYGSLTRRNAIAVLMSIELLFNAVNVAVVGIARYTTPFGLTADNVDLLLTGQVFALFVVTVAAAEVALGLAIVITMYRTQGSVEVGEANIMRHQPKRGPVYEPRGLRGMCFRANEKDNMWVEFKKVPSLMMAEMWKDTFESEGLPSRILPEGDILSWSETVPFIVYVPKGREHVAEEILRKL